MAVHTGLLRLETAGDGAVVDLTEGVRSIVERSGVQAGVACAFAVGATVAITTIEYEPGAIADLNRLFEKIAPRDADYRHHLRWGDDNGSSHVRAALLGPSLTIPFVDGALTLGTWQQILVIEFDTSARRREVVVQMMGE